MNTVHERIKTVLLVVLLCGAVFMAYSTWFYDNPLGDASDVLFASEGAVPGNGEYSFSANAASNLSPVRIGVKNSIMRIGAEYSKAAIDSAYANTRGLMAEALSAQTGSWSRADEEAWQNMLTWQGVLYDYQGIVRADIMADWLWGGQSEVGNIQGRFLLFAINPKDNRTILAIKNPDTGDIYTGYTQINKETVLSVLDQIQGTPCLLACESGESEYKNLAPESFISAAAMPGVINGYNDCAGFTKDQKNTIIKSFGFTPYSISEHVEKDGTQVYIAGSSTIRIEPDGFIVYRNTDTSADATQGIFVRSASETASETEIFETACTLVSRLAQITGGDGKLYPKSFSYIRGENRCVADFGWSVNGVPIDRQKTGYAARVVISDMKVIAVEFYMHRYQNTDRPSNLLNKKLAAAAVENKSGKLEIRYTDGGQTDLEPGWYLKN